MEKKLEKSINFEELLATAIKLPLVYIDRENFLRKELKKHCGEEVVQEAIDHNPAYAGIPVDTINKIANGCINLETTKVTTISAAAGVPGGLAMIGTLPADFVQYYAHVLRIMQKLAYLYGWKELIGEDGAVDDETNHILILFTGVMFGVNEAIAAVNIISKQMAARIAKTLPQKALTKGLIYPIVKKVATLLGFKMTKDVFAKSVSKVVPIAGAVISGGITFASYMPMSRKFKKHFAGLKTSDVDYYQKVKNGESAPYLEVEFSDAESEKLYNELEQEIIEEQNKE